MNMKTHDFLTEIQKGSEKTSPYQDPIVCSFRLLFLSDIYIFQNLQNNIIS